MPTLERVSLLSPGSVLSLDDVETAIVELDDKIDSIEQQLLKPDPDPGWLVRATHSLRQARARRTLFLVRQQQLADDYASERFMEIARQMLPRAVFDEIHARFEEAQA